MVSIERIEEIFKEQFGELKDFEAYFSPGRVNLIGEHLDYNGGHVMPFAIDLGITAIFAPDTTQILEVFSADFNEKIQINLDNLGDVEGFNQWHLYVLACQKIMKSRKLKTRGGKIVLKSDLPLSSGLSSSAALECLILYMMAPQVYEKDRLALAIDAQRAEVEEVGVKCGIMDQYAVAFGKENSAILLDCNQLTHEYVSLDLKGYQLVVINTNFPRNLIESKYNERKSECDKALLEIQFHEPITHLAHAHVISVGAIEEDNLYYRAKHVVTEEQRVLAAFDALNLGQIDYLGNLLWQSHQSLDEDYEVAGEALNCLIHYAHKFRGCIGARMTGAGFGGCAIAIVEKSLVNRFCTYVGRKYETDQGRKADFYLVNPVDGVRRIK
ncbi:MAG: galactokinase [Chitinophagales bacterium]|nr:galactokinase [Chitinophagales bacterium]